MPGVKVYDNFDKALRKFKKKVQNEGILEEVRRRQHYEKPSTKRQRARGAARARHLKKLAKESIPQRKH